MAYKTNNKRNNSEHIRNKAEVIARGARDRKLAKENLEKALNEYEGNLEKVKEDFLQTKQTKKNNPSIIRSSFIEYLRGEFPYETNWTHPVTFQEFEHSNIVEVLNRFKEINPKGYKALYCLWTTNKSRAFIAERLFVCPSTIRRLWDRAIDTIMVMLIYPELEANIIDSFKIS